MIESTMTIPQQFRPRLSTVAPLTAFICWGFGITNVGLGLGLFFLYRTTVAPISVASILSYKAWGVVFFLMGTATVYGLIVNNWEVVRYSQLPGLVVKALWSMALILRCIESPQTILITLVWLFFAYIQAGVYIHFVPRSKNGAI